MIKRSDKNRLKGNLWIYVVVTLIVIVIILAIFLLRGDEDSWIKDSNGSFVKHGNPSAVSDKITMQENALRCAHELYSDFAFSKVKIDSQCLGTCFGYVVDFVHVPRNVSDDQKENQCSDYINNKVTNYIELDKNGDVVRVFEPSLK